MRMDTLTIILVIWICTLADIILRADTRERIITAIKDNGCNTHQQIESKVTRIDNYKLENL